MQFLNRLFLRFAAYAPQSLRDRLGFDKVAHIGAGMFLGLVGSVAGMLLSYGAIWGFVAALIGGLAKEAVDYYKNKKAAANGQRPPHSVERLDAVWTAVGGAAVVAVFALFGVPLT